MAQDIIYNVKIQTGTSDKSIGEISNSIKQLDDQLGELYKEQDRLKAQRNQFEKGQIMYDKWNKKLADVTASVKKVESEYSSLSTTLSTRLSSSLNTIKDLEEAQSLLNDELKSVEIGSEEYKNLSAQLGNVNRELKNLDLSLETLDTEQVGSAAKSVAGGLVDIANGLTLIGLEGESLERMVETMARVEGISYVVGGAMDTWSDGLKLVKNLQDRAAASTALLTTATTGQTIAQRALNLAMNANPAFLLLSAITALAAGFYVFTKRSEEASKAQEKRAEATKKANEEAKKEREQIASNSKEFVTLIARLKATNAGTKERKDLMEDINGKYGITLNNIKDEAKFQETLNGHLIQYIAYQKLKFTLQKNEERQTENLVKQNKIVEDLNKELKVIGIKYDQFQDKFYNIRTGKETFLGNIRSQFGTFAQSIDVAFEKLEDANERLEGYGNTEAYLTEQIKEITKAGSMYVEQNNDVDKSIKSTTKSYSDASKQVDTLTSSIERLEKATSDTASYEASKGIEAELKFQEELAKKTGEYSSVTLKKLMEAEKERSDNYIKNKYNEKIIDAQKAGNDDLVQALQKERDLELAKSNDTYTKNRLKNLEILEKAQEEFADSIPKARENANLLLDDIKSSAESIGSIVEAAISGSFDSLNDSFDSLQDKLFGEEGLFTTLQDKLFGEEGLTFSIEQAVENITDIMLIATEIISAFSEERLSQQLKYNQEQYDSSEEQYSEALANREISQIEYDAKMKRLERDKRERDKKADQDAFKRSKSLAIIQATIAGAQAIIQAYQSGAAYPFVGPATGAIFAGIAGALVASQIAVISSQQYRAARGGIVPGSKGSQDFDSVNALLAPGEVVINSRSAAMFPDLLSGINEAGGGVPLVPKNINNIQNGMDSSNSSNSNNGNSNIFITEAVISEGALTESLDNINRLKNKQRFN